MTLVHKYKSPKATLEHTIQTNGVLLTEEWCEFLRENNFLVGLSMGGPREMHDTYRVDKGGAPTFDKVMRAARLMQKHKVEFNILCTVHAANVEHPLDVYRFFRDELKTQFMQFIPIVERTTPELLNIADQGWGERNHARPLYTQNGSLVTERSVKAEQWGQFLSVILDEWVRSDVGDVFIPTFEAALASWMAMPASLCIFAKTCGGALALEHNGDVYSCDHFVEPKYFLGNIKEQHLIQLVASDKQRQFGNAKQDTLPRYCRDCEVKFACNGECPRNRFIETPDGEPGLNYLCVGYKAFFKHIDYPMRLMVGLLQRGREVPEVMAMLATDSVRP